MRLFMSLQVNYQKPDPHRKGELDCAVHRGATFRERLPATNRSMTVAALSRPLPVTLKSHTREPVLSMPQHFGYEGYKR